MVGLRYRRARCSPISIRKYTRALLKKRPWSRFDRARNRNVWRRASVPALEERAAPQGDSMGDGLVCGPQMRSLPIVRRVLGHELPRRGDDSVRSGGQCRLQAHHQICALCAKPICDKTFRANCPTAGPGLPRSEAVYTFLVTAYSGGMHVQSDLHEAVLAPLRAPHHLPFHSLGDLWLSFYQRRCRPGVVAAIRRNRPPGGCPDGNPPTPCLASI